MYRMPQASLVEVMVSKLLHKNVIASAVNINMKTGIYVEDY